MLFAAVLYPTEGCRVSLLGGGRIIIIKKLFFFPLLFFLLESVVCRWGRGCNPEPDVLTRVQIYRFPFTIYVRTLSTWAEETY